MSGVITRPAVHSPGLQAAFVLLLMTGSIQCSPGDKASARPPRATATSPRIEVAKARTRETVRVVQVQGEVKPFASVVLYAKVSGYLREIRAEPGDQVRQNEVLAVIATPDLHYQARAAELDAQYKRASARSASSLVEHGAIAPLEVQAVRARAAAAEALLATMKTKEAYSVLRAPFAGTITARYADPGALVQNAENGRSGALPVLEVSQLKRLRVQAHVEQKVAELVRVGDAAEIHLLGSHSTLVRSISRTTGTLDGHSRTMLVEIDIDDNQESIAVGSLVQVRLSLRGPRSLEIPRRTLVQRGENAFVPVVTADNMLHLRPVSVGVTEGDMVEITSGLSEGDAVALNPDVWSVDASAPDPVVPPLTADENSKGDHRR